MGYSFLFISFFSKFVEMPNVFPRRSNWTFLTFGWVVNTKKLILANEKLFFFLFFNVETTRRKKREIYDFSRIIIESSLNKNLDARRKCIEQNAFFPISIFSCLSISYDECHEAQKEKKKIRINRFVRIFFVLIEFHSFYRTWKLKAPTTTVVIQLNK